MTEEDWLTAVDPVPVLGYLRWQPQDRRIVQFAAACCRRHWPLLSHESSRDAVVALERFGMGEIGLAELEAHQQAASLAAVLARTAYRKSNTSLAEAWKLHGRMTAAEGVLCATMVEEDGNYEFDRYRMAAARAFQDVSRDLARMNGLTHPADWASAEDAERAAQAALLRCIAGNPFRPPPEAGAASANAIALAQATYDGLDNAPILADALEECGQLELAEHFREQTAHPKGCWVVELLLGRTKPPVAIPPD